MLQRTPATNTTLENFAEQKKIKRMRKKSIWKKIYKGWNQK
jgi:hypothetical protein